MHNSQKGSIAIVASIIMFLALGTLLFTQREKLSGLVVQNTAAVSSATSTPKPLTLGISIPQKEVKAGERIPFNITLKNVSNNTQTVKNYVVSYTVLDESGTVVYTSQPVEKDSSLILKVGRAHTISPAFYAPQPLAPGVYTIRALVTAASRADMVSQNKVTVTGTTRLPPVTPPTTPPVTPPVVEPPVTPPTLPTLPIPGVTSYSATTRAEYATLANTLKTSYVPNAATENDKILFEGIANALTRAVNEIPTEDWNSADKDKVPSTFYLDVQKVGGDTYATKKSWIASVWGAFRSLFAAGEVERAMFRLFGLGYQNNTCGRYAQVEVEPGVYTMKNVEEQTFLQLKASKFRPAENISDFAAGICGSLSAYHALEKFDVAVAKDDADYAARKARSPHDNSGYYVGPEGVGYANQDVMNTAVVKAQIVKPTNAQFFDTAYYDTVNELTAFNNYGPADFQGCTASWIQDQVTISALKEVNSCKKTAMLFMSSNSKYGHIERVKRIDGNESASTYTITTDNAFDQGTLYYSNGNKTTYKRIPTKKPLEPKENSYTIKFDKTKPAGTNTTPSQRSTYISVNTPTLTPLMKSREFPSTSIYGLGLMICTDKSDVIRELPNGQWAKIKFNSLNMLAQRWVDTNAKDIQDTYGKDEPNLPDFSSCKNDVNIDAEVKVYEDAMQEWTKEWNHKAYENKGYVTPGFATAMQVEKLEIEYALEDKIYKFHSCANSKRREPSPEVWEKNQKTWWDTIWLPASTEANKKINEIKDNPTCETLR